MTHAGHDTKEEISDHAAALEIEMWCCGVGDEIEESTDYATE